MSSSAADSKKRKRTKRGNTAASNPPKSDQNVSGQPERPNKVLDLLAQLAAAQGHPNVPSTSNSQQTYQDNCKGKDTKKETLKRGKDSSVAARMVASNKSVVFNTSNHKSRDRKFSQNNNITEAVSKGPKIPEDVLDNISFRFIMNIPDSERLDETRICFQIELAHWFYIDFYVNQEGREDCHNISMRDFLKQIFAHNDFLRVMYHKADKIVDDWRDYKSTVPTYGGILLDPSLNHVLLVQGYYSNKNSWGFPKGKVNESEAPRECAVREVREETGFDFGEHSNGNEHRIQKFINDTMIRLYIVKDVPINYNFSPQTRCEIRQMKWFNIWDLPLDRTDQVASNKGFPARNFYGVYPFVQDIQNYVRREQVKRDKDKEEIKNESKNIVPSLGSGKKSSAFTKVEKKSPSEKKWMEFVNNESDRVLSSMDTSNDNSIHTPKDTLFKPLPDSGNGPGGAPPGSHLAHILANSSQNSTPRNPSISSTALAHPLPIRIPSDRPVYIAPKEVHLEKKVVESIPSSVWASVPSTSFSVSQIEDVLNRMLFNSVGEGGECDISEHMERDSSIDGDEEIKGCIPSYSQGPEMTLPLMDMVHVSSTTSKWLDNERGGGPSSSHSISFIHNHPSFYPFPSSSSSPHIRIEMCSAWNNFKLNGDSILEGVPAYYI